MNVSSIVVQAKSIYIDELVEFFTKCDFCDYHFHDKEKGKIILTVDGEGIEEEIGKFKKIKAVPHVVAADMMMAYSEDELDRDRALLEARVEIPEALANDELTAEQIEIGRAHV